MFRFSVTEDVPYSYASNIAPIFGDSNVLVRLNPLPVQPDIIHADTEGSTMGSGVLTPGEYRLRLFFDGRATSANGEPQANPPFGYGLKFSLRLGEILPGDLILDGVVNLLDVQFFIEALANGDFQFEGDFNGDGVENC